MAAKFTPGPWSVAGHFICADGSHGRIELASVHFEAEYDVRLPVIPNARLMAAAPTLLDACHCVLDWLESFSVPRTSTQAEKDEAVALLVAAIAKAEGSNHV